MIVVGLCLDCKWWEAPGRADDGWGLCTITESINDVLVGHPEHPESKAKGYGGGAEGSNVNYGILKTIGDFGCVQFEAKE